MDWGIYIHIPFCRRKCYYCDFPSYAGRERYMASYVDALCQEIRARGAFYVRGDAGGRDAKIGGGDTAAAGGKMSDSLGGEISSGWGLAATCYIGGGTPTALPSESLVRIVREVRPLLHDDAELTVECNPGTVDGEYLATLKSAGVNRLSFGVQSFDDALLRRIGRIHTGAEAREAVEMAWAAGFTNISLDLMYGLPGQTLTDLEASVTQALALAPTHISIYGLQLEEGTVFARQNELGKLNLPSDELSEKMYDYMVDYLPRAGYARYEISNFARAGFESRHNLSYWQDTPYLGLGAAAHSYLNGTRYAATADIAEYIAGVTSGDYAITVEEERSERAHIEEFSFLALRTAAGIDRARFRATFGRDIYELYAEPIAAMKSRGLLQETDNNIFLTPLGMKFGNDVFEAFLL